MNKVYWMTGLPCSGKTTLSREFKKVLSEKGYNVVHLDGDDVRKGLCKDLGFSDEDRKENLRRVAYVSNLFSNNGNIVLASFITPTNELRDFVKDIIGEKMESIYVKCSLEECERRDVKGMYAKARKGEIKDFTGVSALFEEPIEPSLVINTKNKSLESCVNEIIKEFSF